MKKFTLSVLFTLLVALPGAFFPGLYAQTSGVKPATNNPATTVVYADNPAITAALKYQGAYAPNYAYKANDVVTIGGNVYFSLIDNNKGYSPINHPNQWTPLTLTSGSLPIIGGTLTGPLVLSGDPVSPRQAADKNYVDTHSSLITYGTTAGTATQGNDARVVGAVQRTGDTLTGPLVLAAAPTAPLGAATKSYVDAASAVAAQAQATANAAIPSSQAGVANGVATLDPTTKVPVAQLPVMGASGSGHAPGVVPDPGASAGTSRYLREDGSWSSLAGSVTSFNGRSGAVAPANGDYSFSLISGILAHSQLPSLLGADIPNNSASTSGNAATATSLASAPAQATSGQYCTGITINGACNSAQVQVAQVAGAAPLASPGLTGIPVAPTAVPGTNTTQLATTAFSATAVAAEATTARANEALATLKSNNGSDYSSLPTFRSNIGLPFSTINTQPGSSYTLAPSDCSMLGGTVALTFAGNVSVTLPTPGASFPAGCKVYIKALMGLGFTATLTPASSTIDGIASLPLIYPGDGVFESDGTNWKGFGGYGVRGASNLSHTYGAVYTNNLGVVADASLTGIPKYSASGVPTTAVAGTDYAAATEPIGAAAQVTANAAIPSAQKAAANGVASLNASTQVPVAQLPIAGASGAGHAPGILPDPGATAGNTRYYREDGTFANPLPAYTGDVTTTAGATATTLATANASPGVCGDATHVAQVTVDGKGRTTTCTPVTVAPTSGMVTSALGFTPAPAPALYNGSLATLLAYHKFDECYKTPSQCGQSYSITDYSGNNNTPTLPTPTTAVPTLTTQGLTYSQGTFVQFLNLHPNLNGARVFQIWLSFPATDTALSTNDAFILGNNVSGGGLTVQTNKYQALGGYYNGLQPIGIATAGIYNSTQCLDTYTSETLLTVYLGTNTSTDPNRVYLNQAECSAYGIQGATAGAQTALGGNLLLGSTVGSIANQYYPGTIRAFTAYTTTSTTSAGAAALFAALSQNYSAIKTQVASTGVSFTPPASQSRVNQITVVGDSESMKTPVVATYAYSNPAIGGVALNDTYTINNVAKGGEQCSEILANQALRDDTYYTPQAAKNVATLWCGTNEFNIGGAAITARGVWNLMIAWAANKRAHGWKTLVSPMMSRGTGSNAGNTGHTADYWKDQINPIIRAEWPLYFDGIFDIPGDPIMGADSAAANSTNFPDSIHMNNAPTLLTHNYWANAINKLFGSTELSPTPVGTTPYQILGTDNYLSVTANSALTLPDCLGYGGSWIVSVAPGLTVTVANKTSVETISLFGGTATDYSTTPLSLTAGVRTRFKVVVPSAATAGCQWQTY